MLQNKEKLLTPVKTRFAVYNKKYFIFLNNIPGYCFSFL